MNHGRNIVVSSGSQLKAGTSGEGMRTRVKLLLQLSSLTLHLAAALLTHLERSRCTSGRSTSRRTRSRCRHAAGAVLLPAPRTHCVLTTTTPSNYTCLSLKHALLHAQATDNVIKAINVSNNRILDLRGAIGEQFDTEDLKYHKLDTHWNKYGAFLGYKSIINHINIKTKI